MVPITAQETQNTSALNISRTAPSIAAFLAIVAENLLTEADLECLVFGIGPAGGCFLLPGRSFGAFSRMLSTRSAARHQPDQAGVGMVGTGREGGGPGERTGEQGRGLEEREDRGEDCG